MIILIAAMSRDRSIGQDNELLWHISEDLKRFKNLTSWHTIVMGRNTYESIGKLLPNRVNHIISSTYTDTNITDNDKNIGQEYQLFHSLDTWFDRYKDHQDETVYIIGWGQIYNTFLPYADQIELTVVHSDIHGDTHFPVFEEEFVEQGREEYKNDDYTYDFISYHRKEHEKI